MALRRMVRILVYREFGIKIQICVTSPTPNPSPVKREGLSPGFVPFPPVKRGRARVRGTADAQPPPYIFVSLIPNSRLFTDFRQPKSLTFRRFALAISSGIGPAQQDRLQFE